MAALTFSYGEWLAAQTRTAKAVYRILQAIPGAVALATATLKLLQKDLLEPLSWDRILIAMLFLQAFVALFLSFTFRSNSLSESATGELAKSKALQTRYDRALAARDRFLRPWQRAWVIWSLLYLIWAIDVWVSSESAEVNSLHIKSLSYLLNNFTTFYLLLTYRELAQETQDTKRGRLHFEYPLVFVLLLAFAVQLCYFELDLHHPVIRAAAVASEWVGSFAAGTAIALLVGRLDSKLIEGPVTALVIGYVYAAIQSVLPFFFSESQDAVFILFVTSIAFIGKVTLFLYVKWILDTNILLYYLAEVRELFTGLDEIRPRILRLLNG